jgi:hypothetical protein
VGADAIKRNYAMERVRAHVPIVAGQSAMPAGPPAAAPNLP